jgi:hypothetical protein
VRMVRESDIESSRGDPVFEIQLSRMDQYVTCHTEVDETTTSQSDAGLQFHELFVGRLRSCARRKS